MKKLIEIVRDLPNKGKTHVFLGSPLSDGCDKTTVEPGNNFSPGVWTCGISTCVKANGDYFTPDLLPDSQFKWTFGGKNGVPPVVESVWNAGENVEIKNRLAHLGCEGSEGVDFCAVEITSFKKAQVTFFIVVRDIGPAGGKINSMIWDETAHTLVINNSIRITSENFPSGCEIVKADENHTSPMAVIYFAFEMNESCSKSLSFKVEHGFSNKQFGNQLITLHPFKDLTVGEGIEKSIKDWEESVPAKVFCPDNRIEKVWEREIFHILSAMECGLPRIGAVNYPMFWMRDGVIILRSLDLIGRHDLARIGNENLATMFFSGGFGAESDAPGEAIWSLISHVKMTKDIKWLEEIFPFIEKRVKIIEKMLTATEPIRLVGENKIPFYMDSPGINILCFPAVNGTIHGRMDWHSPDFFINCWTECGLKLASEAADLLEKKDLAHKWLNMAEKLNKAIEDYLLPQYGNERDPIITPYPSNALQNMKDAVAQKFEEWYLKNRLSPTGERIPETLWTYFEAAQIHNAILLGFSDIAWKCLDGMLEPNSMWDTSAFIEGNPGEGEMMPFRNWENARGWLDRENAFGGNMPHNWTSAEMVNLIRDIFVYEEGDTLILGKGVPKDWIEPGKKFGVQNMPTDLGVVSYMVTVGPNKEINIDYKGPEKYKLDFQI